MSATQELVVPEQRRSEFPSPVQGSDASTLMTLAQRASSPEQMMQILAVKERWEANEARKAFVADMAEFKKSPPVIYKNKHVGFKSKDGRSRTDYDHATHSEVTMKIIAALAQHGFSHRWVTTQPSGQVCVTCIITHRLGHSESQELTAPPDTSGLKSPVQAIASTRTLLERYTLLGATGLSASDLPDADDRSDDKTPDVNPDVWTALGDASKEGEEQLRKMWANLSDATTDIICEHYAEDWSALKAQATAADAKRKGVDTAHAMRQLMKEDIDEKAMAKKVADENSRLNRESRELLEAAWGVLNSDERRAWKGWIDLRKTHV